MDKQSGSSALRSSSRSKRSTTNLSNLRLAPLSTKFAEPRTDEITVKSPYDEDSEVTYARQHSSYLQGRSAPSTPGILSRSSSRKHFTGGLSRRGSLYEEDAQYQYAGSERDGSEGWRAEVGSGQIPKAKSEAALMVNRRLAGPGVPLKKHYGRSKSGLSTPKIKKATLDDDWLSRTRASTNALVQEAKGQSWLASRESTTSLTQLDSDDDDEGYEEMAALSASQAKLKVVTNLASPSASRVRSPVWGSRYGSRNPSRRTSRRGSMTSMRTPLAHDAMAEYFDPEPLTNKVKPDFVDEEDESEYTDEGDVSRLADNRSFGLGGFVDRLMGFNLFNVEEREETTEDEAERVDETEQERKRRTEAEQRRRQADKATLTNRPPASRDGGSGQSEGGWQDAAWLFSVATKALF